MPPADTNSRSVEFEPYKKVSFLQHLQIVVARRPDVASVCWFPNAIRIHRLATLHCNTVYANQEFTQLELFS